MVLDKEIASNLPLINLEINQNKVQTLIDSGSTINIISRTIYDKIKDTNVVKIIKESSNFHCIAANNTKINLGELISITFKINNLAYSDYFHVTDKVSPSFDIILGIKFLDKHSHGLGNENGKRYFKLNDMHVPLLTTRSSKNLNVTLHGLRPLQMQSSISSLTLVNLEKLTLQPHMYAFVNMYTQVKNEHICNAFVDALDHELGFVVPPQLVNINKNHAKVLFLNSFDFEVTIPSRISLISNCWCAKLAKHEYFPKDKYAMHTVGRENKDQICNPVQTVSKQRPSLGTPCVGLNKLPVTKINKATSNNTAHQQKRAQGNVDSYLQDKENKEFKGQDSTSTSFSAEECNNNSIGTTSVTIRGKQRGLSEGQCTDRCDLKNIRGYDDSQMYKGALRESGFQVKGRKDQGLASREAVNAHSNSGIKRQIEKKIFQGQEEGSPHKRANAHSTSGIKSRINTIDRLQGQGKGPPPERVKVERVNYGYRVSQAAHPRETIIKGYRVSQEAPTKETINEGYRVSQGQSSKDTINEGYRVSQGQSFKDTINEGYRVSQGQSTKETINEGYRVSQGQFSKGKISKGYRVSPDPASVQKISKGYRVSPDQASVQAIRNGYSVSQGQASVQAIRNGYSVSQGQASVQAIRNGYSVSQSEASQESSDERKSEKQNQGQRLEKEANQTIKLLNEDLLEQEQSSLWDIKAEEIPVANPKSEQERCRIIEDHISAQNLDKSDQVELRKLCVSFSKLFYVEGDNIGLVNKIICKIETKAHPEPIYTKQFRLSIHDEKIIQEKVRELLKNDIIKRGSSPYNSPVFLIRQHGKGRDDYRMVIDYRKINELVIQSRYKIPQIEDMLTKLRNNGIFTCLDIKNAFNSLRIDDESQSLLAFSTNNASYVFKTLIFGLSSGPSIYSNLLHEILHEFVDTNQIVIFIDDILIFTKDRQTHYNLLLKIFNKLAEFNVKLKLAKCEFMQNSVKFLGHEISKEGIRPLVDKVQAIKNLKSPQKRKELMSVLGLINYYMKFIPNLALYSNKLTELLRKDIKYIWTEDHEEALSIIKELISEHTTLCYPDPNKDYYLVTDASGYAAGSYLGQKDDQDNIKPIGFYSRVFSETQSRYSATEREMLAIIIALEHFHPYISASKIHIMTDHRPLLGVINASNSKRLEKMKVKILDMNINFLYIPGKENVLADLLSRAVPTYNKAMKLEKEFSEKRLQKIKEYMPEKVFHIDSLTTPIHSIVEQSLCSINAITRAQARREHSPENDKDDLASQQISRSTTEHPTIQNATDTSQQKSQSKPSIRAIKLSDNIDDVLNNSQTLINNQISFEDIQVAQRGDQNCKDIDTFLSGGKVDSVPVNYFKHFCRINNLICFTSSVDNEINYRYYLPTKELQTRALYNAHSSHLNNHVGYTRCLKNLAQITYWPNQAGDLHDFISSCEDCILYKKIRCLKVQGSLKPSTAPNQVLYLDLVGPFTHSGPYVYILSVFCAFSQFLWLYPVKDASSDEVIRVMFGSHIFLYGIPLGFATDNGTSFSAKNFTHLCEIYIIALKFICPRAPWQNEVEKLHKDVKNHLRCLLNGAETKKWHEFLPTISRIHNTNFTTPMKTTPFTLYFGRKPRNSIISDITFPNENFPPLLATHLYNVQKLYKQAADNKGIYHEKLKSNKKAIQDSKIKVGSKLYVKKPYIQGRSTALQNVMHGPFVVSKMIGNYIVEYLDNSNTPRRCHINNCKILNMAD